MTTRSRVGAIQGEHVACSPAVAPYATASFHRDGPSRQRVASIGRCGHRPTRVAPSAVTAVEQRSEPWNETHTMTMIVSADPDAVEDALSAGRLRCGCGSSLTPWGHARGRWLRGPGGQRRWQRPRRARCPSCGTTTVLLADWSLPRRRDTIDVIGPALLAHVGGLGHRPIAARLAVPEGTVRGWLRRARSNAERIRVVATVLAHDCDPELHPLAPTGTSFGDAVDALGTAAAAFRRRVGIDRPAWQTIVAFTRGRLLAPRWT